MKIKINEQEEYIINFPDEVTGDELIQIAQRLQTLTKLIDRNLICSVMKTKNSRPGNIPGSRKHYSREQKIEYLKRYYVDRDVDNLVRELGLQRRNSLSQNICNWKTQISPQEVGLTEWPILKRGNSVGWKNK